MSPWSSGDLFETRDWQERNERVWTVSDLVRVCATLVEEAFPTVLVEGEVSNVSRPASGHVYFTLKDEAARLPAVLFRSDKRRIPYELQEGAHILCRGRLSIYVQGGRFQLYVSWFEPAGLGRLMAELERLKARLAAEGLFDEDRKRPLPPYPTVVGVVTSPTGAAIRDIVKVTRRRWPARIVLSPATVQGDEAPESIVAALERLVRTVPVDVVICGRGGGSIEDLWAFNDERVVRAVASCPVPVVSAVGHERDWVLTDLAADVRAATPSAAAELVVPDKQEVLARIEALGRRLELHARRLLETRRVRLQLQQQRLEARTTFLLEPRQRLADLEHRLESAIDQTLAGRRHWLSGVSAKLRLLHPQHRIATTRDRIQRARSRLGIAAVSVLATKRRKLALLEGRLQALGPQSVLDRGYSLLLTPDGSPVRTWNQVTEGQRLEARLGRGALTCAVEERHPPKGERNGETPSTDSRLRRP